MRYTALLLLLLAGCSSVCGVDVRAEGGSDGRHHGRAMAGPQVNFASGASAYAMAGKQFDVAGEGSSRQTTPEFQFEIGGSVPVWRRR